MARFKDRTFMCMALLVWIAMALASEEKKNSMPEVIVEGSPAVAAVGTFLLLAWSSAWRHVSNPSNSSHAAVAMQAT